MAIEDSIKRCNEALVKSVAMVRKIQEYSDPVKFDESFQNVLGNQDVTLDFIYEGTHHLEEIRRLPQETRVELEKQIENYIGLKALLQQTAEAGYRFDWDIGKALRANQKMQELTGFLGVYHTFCINLLAVEVIKEFKDRELTEAEKLDDQGDELNQQRRYEEALPFFDNALLLSPRFCLAWINKGIALKNLRRIDESITCYDHVIDDIDPRYKKALYNKAVALWTKGEIDGARTCVNKALEIDPSYQIALKLKRTLG